MSIKIRIFAEINFKINNNGTRAKRDKSRL